MISEPNIVEQWPEYFIFPVNWPVFFSHPKALGDEVQSHNIQLIEYYDEKYSPG